MMNQFETVRQVDTEIFQVHLKGCKCDRANLVTWKSSYTGPKDAYEYANDFEARNIGNVAWVRMCAHHAPSLTWEQYSYSGVTH
jgi:hypothetical protein